MISWHQSLAGKILIAHDLDRLETVKNVVGASASATMIGC
jgi:hypothetical protein